MTIPNFSLPVCNFSKKNITQDDFAQGLFVLYLYPKDMTSGCTIEAQNFRDLKPEFEKIGVGVFGLSKDSEKRHDKFIEKESLNFPLIVDEDSELIATLGSWVEKSMYGRKYMGVDRSTFLIRDGVIVREWRKVKVPGHATEILNAVKSLG
jgi:thioredoxin-dependent peroxiredoxin